MVDANLTLVTAMNTAQTYAKKQNKTGYEVLMYNQLCRWLECTFKILREGNNEGTNKATGRDTPPNTDSA